MVRASHMQGSRANWIVGIALTISALAMAAPLLWTLVLSLKPNDELLRGTQTAFSAPYTLRNYADILGHSAVFGWLLNSTIVSVGFSEAMAPIAGGATFTVTCASPCVSPTGTLARDASNTNATFTATANFDALTKYTATVTLGNCKK